MGIPLFQMPGRPEDLDTIAQAFGPFGHFVAAGEQMHMLLDNLSAFGGESGAEAERLQRLALEALAVNSLGYFMRRIR